MKASIITPAYNTAPIISKCIESVKNQTHKDVEHIIINDGSEDDTRKIISSYEGTYNLVCIDQSNAGIASAMTRGFIEATGDILAWIDADNYYNYDTIEKVSLIFEKDETVDVVYGNVDVVDNDGRMINTYKPPKTLSLKQALIGTTGAIPVQPAVFFKKSLYQKVGGFDKRYRMAGDYDFWIRALAENPKSVYIDSSLGNYLRTMSGISQSARGVLRGYKEMRTIAAEHHQPFIGQVSMFLKYARGYISVFLK